MGTYETLFITLPTLSEAEEATVVSSLAEIISGSGGNLVCQDRLGRRRLAYPIKKFEDGVYNLFVFEGQAALVSELERRIRISDKVLRWLTVRVEEQFAEEAKERAVRDAEARKAAEKAKAEAAEKAKAEAKRREAEAQKAAEQEVEPEETQAAPDAADEQPGKPEPEPSDAAEGGRDQEDEK